MTIVFPGMDSLDQTIFLILENQQWLEKTN